MIKKSKRNIFKPRIQQRRKIHRQRCSRRHYQHIRRAGGKSRANPRRPRHVRAQSLLLARLPNAPNGHGRSPHEALRRRALRRGPDPLGPLELGALGVVLGHWQAIRVILVRQDGQDLGCCRKEVHPHVQRAPRPGLVRQVQSSGRPRCVGVRG